MGGPGIVGFGAYVPILRLERKALAEANGWANPALAGQAAGRRSMASWDEDAVTMAVQAARHALATVERPAVGALTLASTTLPFADRLNAGIVAAALDLDSTIDALDAGGAQRVGTTALIRGLRGLAPGAGHLVIASELRPGKPGSAIELGGGDGAGALLLGTEGVVAEFLGAASETADFVDHHRAAGAAADYVLEERWLRDEAVLRFVPETIARALAAAGLDAASVDRALLALPNPEFAKGVAKAAGIRPEALGDPLVRECGQMGAAHPLALLVQALETAEPGQLILLAGFGQGCDALLFRTTERLAELRPKAPLAAQMAAARIEASYLRFLSFRGQVSYEWGIRAERDNRTAQTVAWRKSRDVYGFVGGRCDACGTIQFPRSRVCVDPACRRTDTQSPHRLADTVGTIKTFTEDWQASTPDPPLRYGNIALSGGGNIFMEIADAPVGGIAIGQDIRMVFRVKDYDQRRQFRRYFWKAVPVAEGQGGGHG